METLNQMNRNIMRTKHILLALFALLFSITVHPVAAQSTFKLDPQASTFISNSQIGCIYQYKVVSLKRETAVNPNETGTIIDTYNTILQANASVSKFWDWNLLKMDSIQFSSTIELSRDSLEKLKYIYDRNIRCLFLPVIFKNYPNGKITVTDKIVQDDYIYQEDKIERQWTLIDDTLTVCGYRCNKAETTFGGRKWVAWYAPEIAISDGPWKLYGLPSLILKAIDSTKTHSFEAVAIRNSTDPIYLRKDITLLKIAKKDFYKNKKYFEGEKLRTEYLSDDQKKKMSIYKGVFFVGKQRTGWNTISKNSSLEFE